MKTYTIVVLNDGETYSGDKGCRLMEITESANELLMLGVKVYNLDADQIVSSIPIIHPLINME